ncbi:MAG: FAD-binding oxidoreductase [Nakamurella sp.]
MARVAVIGAGMVGTSCAYYLARDGHDVTVIDRGPVAGGTTSRGEGNILVSDKAPGPELDLALWSATLWRDLGAASGDGPGDDALELEHKGSLVVGTSPEALGSLMDFASGQTAAGVESTLVPARELLDHEPNLAPDLPGGVLYPGDMQVQPAKAAAALLRAARIYGAIVHAGTEVIAAHTKDGAIASLRCRNNDGDIDIATDAVVNASGTWGGEISTLLGAPIPVLPRRGFILVTEPLPRVVRHKVYSADYVANVASGDAGLETSVVVEGTRGGPVLIGASRERVGFDATMSYPVVRQLAAQAIQLFPMLKNVSLMRAYRGFRPYCPDHLPVIGPDPRVRGVWHACGHEGAGIGLAPATGALIADMLAGRATPVDPEPFSPTRFAAWADGAEAAVRDGSEGGDAK